MNWAVQVVFHFCRFLLGYVPLELGSKKLNLPILFHLTAWNLGTARKLSLGWERWSMLGR